MASLNIKSFAVLVQEQAANIQGRCARLIDFTVGSLLRAIVEANAGLALWLQSLALKILATSRLSTSTGSDVDSFVGDWGLTRLDAQTALGVVTFSRFTPGAQAVVPVGAIVSTTDGSQDFAVIADASNTLFNAGLDGYVVPVGIASVDVPVAAINGGSGGNVLGGTVTVIKSTITYIDTVVNAAPMAGGGEEESDAQLQQRFRDFIASLSKATRTAISEAIASRRLGVTFKIVDNKDYSLAFRPGFFFVVVDDGTGSPPQALLDDIFAAVDAVRADTVLFAVHAPQITNVSVSMTLSVADGYDANTVKGLVGSAIRASIQAIPIGEGLSWTKLAQLAYEATQGVINVTSLQLNSATADIEADPRFKLVPNVITVN